MIRPFLLALLTAVFGYAPVILAQNTIGGVVARVPEEEVERQSKFLSAEKERILGNYDKAIEQFKAFVYENPKSDAAWYGLARCFSARKLTDQALDAIASAIAVAPDNQWYLLYQADLFSQTGRIKDAIGVYETLVARFPETPEFFKQLAYLNLLNENPKGALKALEKLEKLTGVNEEVVSKKHIIYIGLNDNKKAALELKKLTAAYPSDIQYKHQLAAFYETVGEKENARQVYAEILKINPDDAAAKLALAANSDKNGSDLAKLQSLKPLFSDPQIGIDAKVKEILPYFDKLKGQDGANLHNALLELSAMLETTHPDDPKTWSLHGDLLYLANRYDEALVKYKKCIALNPRVFSVWENTMNILATQLNFKELYAVSEKAMDSWPNQPVAYYYFGMAANALGKHDEALSQLQQALLMTGNNPSLRIDLLDQLGISFLGKKDYKNAISKYEEALAKGGDQNPLVLEHYGDALSLAGQDAKAVDQWKKANAIRPSQGLAQKIAAGKL